MPRIGQLAVFAALTALAVFGGTLLSWEWWLGPLFGYILTLIALHFALRTAARRFRSAGGGTPAVLPRAGCLVFAAACFFGGGFGALLTANPDGHIQPGATSDPMGLIWLGTFAGAVLGLVLVLGLGLIQLVLARSDGSIGQPKRR